MKIMCKSCSQPIEVDGGSDLTGAQCPSCGAPLLAPNAPPPATGANKPPVPFSSWFAVAVSIVSLALAIYCTSRVQKFNNGSEIAATDPVTTLKNFYRIQHDQDYLTADGAFWRMNHREIMKTLEMVSTNSQGDYTLVLFRYSVGDKVFREGMWLKNIGGKWYIVPYLSADYNPTPYVAQHQDWFEQADKKKKDWEKDSAQRE